MGLGAWVTRRRLHWALAIEVAALAVALVASGAWDGLVHGADQGLSAFFTIAVGVVNAVAAWEMGRELRKPGGRQPWEHVSVIVGQAAAVPLLFVPLWIEGSSRVHSWLDVVICSLAAVALVISVCVTLAAVFGRPQDSLIKSWTVVLALLPLAGSVQVWYSDYYRPYHQRPNVNIVANLDEVGSGDGLTRLEATVALENSGSTELVFFDAVYTVTGLDTAPAAVDTTPEDVDALLQGARVAQSDPAAAYKGLLEVGRLIPRGGHLAPDQKLMTTIVFDVTNQTQDKVRLTVHLSALVGEMSLDFEECKHKTSNPYTCRSAPLPTQGWLQGQLGDDPVARTVLEAAPGGTPSLRTEFNYADSETGVLEFLPSQELEDVYPDLNTRGFTTSVEYGLSP